MDAHHTTRPPAVAGMFYPGVPAVLADEVDVLLATAVPPAPAFGKPKVLICPHAGYIYSGSVAASGYALLEKFASTIRRVVLLGPCHRVAVRGLAVPDAVNFATPLGTVPLDQQAISAALKLPQVIRHDGAHATEHSLEVQLPFLQQVLDNFSLVPLAVGYATPDEVAEVLDLLWGGPETLIVISSDLSHYHPYTDAQRRDQHTVDDITHLRLLVDHEQACGATPINGLIEVARPASASARPAQFRRHRRRQSTRGRLRELRFYGA
jgi:AmmeMemoRadiSam system protein B